MCAIYLFLQCGDLLCAASPATGCVEELLVGGAFTHLLLNNLPNNTVSNSTPEIKAHRPMSLDYVMSKVIITNT